MGKQTRAKFLITMGAFSLAALAGCAGGAPPDSAYQGTYQSTYSLPAIGENGYFSFTVEKKGRMVGSFTNVDTNVVYAFDGTVVNSGKFTGTLSNASGSSSINGLLVTKGTSNSTSAGGNFTVTRSGTPLQGSFVIDGTISQAQSAYQGIYSGVYGVDDHFLFGGSKLNGLASYTIDSKGNIIGSLTRSAETGLLTGVISNTGAFSATVKFIAGPLPLSGTLVKTADGSSQGNFTVSSGGVLYPGSFSKSASVVAGGDSPYKGSFRGTYGIPERNENGTISYTVDPSGAIIGFFSQSLNKPVGTLVASVENDGGFNGTLTYNATEVNALPVAERPLYGTRNIQGKMGSSTTGTSGDFSMTINGISFAGNFEASIGGSEVNSTFRAAYTDAGHFPTAFDASRVPGGKFTTASSIDISVDKEGSIIGSMGSHRFDGRATNDGRVIGQLRGTDNNWYPIRGIISKVMWVFGTDKVPGLAGNLYVTIGVEEYPISIKMTGGDGGGA